MLFGHVNPSARLPLTFPNMENETQFTPAQWPGLPDPKKPAYAVYSEELLVGYRYYDYHNLTFSSGFPFGHGLSYTSFGYSGFDVAAQGSDVVVSFRVTNAGSVVGAEVAQLYLGFPTSAGEPPWQLKGFHKTASLAPGASEDVKLTLNPRAMSTWDTGARAFVPVKGQFQVAVGASSRDHRAQGSFSY